MRPTREIEFETKKISKLVWDYALPAIIGTMVNATYNIVDRIFIGQGVGALAISGLAVTFPVMNLTAALGMLVGAGASSRISISLGKRDHERAEKILGNSFLLTIALNLVFITLLMIFLEPILMAFGASEETYPFARDYLQIILPGNIFVTMTYSFNSMMRASGYPQKAMYTMLIGAFLNIILDPIFIFVFGMGIAGVAWATIISMFLGMLFVMHHFTRKTSSLRLKRKNIRFEKSILIAIISIGLSPFFMQVAASGVAVLMNTSLKTYGGDLAIGAYGILLSMFMLIIMFVIGLNQGLQPIIGYNYGAESYPRVKATFYYGLKIATVVTTAGFLLGIFFPRLFARAFTSDVQLLDLAENALRISILAFPLVGFQVVLSGFFQSIGQAKKSIILSLSRQLIFLIPSIIILPRLFGLNGVWAATPVSDFMGALLAAYFFWRQIKVFRTLEQSNRI
ncbi:MAG: MATE family efflux transporter [Dysgonamonadaceae bacterium]|nr:MATE family efflux transporter [Dysgonamonadaceae bacterium]MDD4728963.1 MATE family efflux transporter [Dysgonamonadaceae bacterium]